MVKRKAVSSGGSCAMCNCSSGCMILVGLVTAILGLLMIFPAGWFTFEHSFGLLVFLLGLKVLFLSFKK